MKKEEQSNALSQIKAVYEDGEMTLPSGNTYKFTKTKHKHRLKVFSYLTSIQNQMASGNMAFLDSKEFDNVYDVISNLVTFNDSLLSKLPEHWEEYPEDYILFITTAMSAISYPFLKGSLTS